MPVYGCLACQSFSNPSDYRESPEQLVRDLEWHKGVAKRNSDATKYLLGELQGKGVELKRIVDIGAGIGTLLKTALELGSEVIGYDVNPLTQSYARDVNGIDVRPEIWTKDTDCGDFTLVTCVMVLEHIEQPRELIRNLVEACLEKNASLFISVPFVDRDKWHFLHDPNPSSPGTPFFDQDVHVTHFSSRALEALLREFGMSKIEWIRRGLWHGPVAQP